MVLEFCMGTRPLFSSENVKSFTVKMLWLQTFNLFFSHVLVNSLFAEPSVGEGLSLKSMVHLTFHTCCLSLCFANSISLLSDHLKSSIPFFPPLCFSAFICHPHRKEWLVYSSAGRVIALWRFLPFLHFAAFAEMVICHCACAARCAALHRLVRERERERLLTLFESINKDHL